MLSFLFLPVVSFAQVNPQETFEQTLNQGGVISGEVPDVEESIQGLVNIILGFIGVLAFIIVLYAGGLWLTAAGNDDKVAQAKKLLSGAVFGLIIVFTAFFLVNFVLGQLGEALGDNTPPPASNQ